MIAVLIGFEPTISGLTDQRGLQTPLQDQIEIRETLHLRRQEIKDYVTHEYN